MIAGVTCIASARNRTTLGCLWLAAGLSIVSVGVVLGRSSEKSRYGLRQRRRRRSRQSGLRGRWWVVSAEFLDRSNPVSIALNSACVRRAIICPRRTSARSLAYRKCGRERAGCCCQTLDGFTEAHRNQSWCCIRYDGQNVTSTRVGSEIMNAFEVSLEA